MKHVLAYLCLSAAAQALTIQDLAGSWKAIGYDGDGSVMELWYDAGGAREMRSLAYYNDQGEYRMHLLGTWSVSGQDVVEKTTSGWISFDGSTDPVTADPKASSSSKVELVAGSPRMIRITDCDSPTLCSTTEFTFVSATKQFTLPDLGGGTTSLRRGTGSRILRLNGSGRLGFAFLLRGRAFDLRGRSLVLP